MVPDCWDMPVWKGLHTPINNVDSVRKQFADCRQTLFRISTSCGCNLRWKVFMLNGRCWTGHFLKVGSSYEDSILANLRAKDVAGFRNLTEWQQPTLKCCYHWLVAKYQVLMHSSISVARYRLMKRSQTRQHLQARYLTSSFQWETTNADHLFPDCVKTRTSLVRISLQTFSQHVYTSILPPTWPNGVTTQNTNKVIFTTIRTSDLLVFYCSTCHQYRIMEP